MSLLPTSLRTTIHSPTCAKVFQEGLFAKIGCKKEGTIKGKRKDVENNKLIKCRSTA